MSDEGLQLGLEGFAHASELGRGGFGVVYKAWETALRRWVAIKVLDIGRLNGSARERFTHELQAAARVSTHPNIVTIYGQGFDVAERPCIIMEWMAKGALQSPEVAAHPWPWQRAAETGVKLCGALQAVHRSGIVHQDVKPENVFLSEYDEPAIGDFGASVIQSVRSTDYAHRYLTIAHAAPELLSGADPDPRMDIYALASSLVALLRGFPPFSNASGDTPALIIERIRNSEPPDLRPLGVPDPLCTTLERALAKNPGNRPQTAGEFGEALRSAQQAVGLSPTPIVVSNLPLEAHTAPKTTTYEMIRRHSLDSSPRAAKPIATTPAAREERKVITVLCAELGRFRAGDALDPEDMRALLAPALARLRVDLERFGGTVASVVGDSVMALFGVPISHEDDPERAVRAALAIREWVLEDDVLQLIIAINTDEALVSFSPGSTDREAVAEGEVITATARLQAAAPDNHVLVGETTYRATSQVITYGGVGSLAVKGKAEPLRVWEPLGARSRFGVDLTSALRSPLVGRTHELGVLADALERVRLECSPRLITLVGVPGIGKSRMVAELFRTIDDNPNEIVYWRQGRSLPYGDGVTFWALGEMVKAQTGILETDSQDAAEDKLRTSVAELIHDVTDAPWVEGHLRPLVGLGSGAAVGSDRRDEAFAAWRRFFERLAELRPLVLVFEDLHWADDNLLDFVEYLVEWTIGVPILIVCTARPELFERRETWAGGTRHATTLSLSPLSDEETARLISNLSERPVMAAATQRALLSRAGGNPLYAEQYIRMLAERGEAEEFSLPETVQGIISARLDALPAEEKALLQSAAVIGKVFWLGAVARASGMDRRAAELLLHALERKDFLQRARRSSVADEAEYTFLHVLVRDVAYGRIPRGARAEEHRLAAEWIGSLGRAEDHAEMLAHHYLSAIELWRAASQPIDPVVGEQALASVSESGDRAMSLSAYSSAVGFYQSALELAAQGSRERAQLLFKLGQTLDISGDPQPELLAAACEELEAVGDTETAAEAEATLADLHWHRGDTDRSAEHISRARELVDGREPSRATASVMSSISRRLLMAGESAEAIRFGREALGFAEKLAIDELRARALNYIGASRLDSGDRGGFGDLEQSLAIAVEANVPTAICAAQMNLTTALFLDGQLERSAALVQAATETASRYGLIRDLLWIRGGEAADAFYRGDWDGALALDNEFITGIESGSPHYYAACWYSTRAQIRLGRVDDLGALGDAESALGFARLTKDPQILFPALSVCANIFRETGDAERSAGLADELLAHLRVGTGTIPAVWPFHILAWTLYALGRGEELIANLPQSDVPWVRAALAFSGGDMRRSADICGEMGAASEEAHDRLWLAASLIEQNRRADADIQLQRALAFYRSVGATRYIREAERLLTACG